MNKEQLLKLIGLLIKAADGELVDDKNCFPCPSDQHEHYKIVRDCLQKMYDEADFTQSSSFLNETKGKSEKFIAMKAKLYRAPIKRRSHREELIEMLCNIETIEKADNYINMQHKRLHVLALQNLGECNDA
jgi:hypothetical protein